MIWVSSSSWFRRAFYEFLYWRGKPRWDTGVTPPEVRDLIEVQRLPPGRALDVGCGSGTNVIYLAEHGFQVVGIDFIRRAIDRARERVKAAHLQVELYQANVLGPLNLGRPFDFVLDIGCFHNFDRSGRALYAENLARWTHKGSIFLVYAFYPATTGPRRFGVSPEALEKTFAKDFKVVASTVDESNTEQDSAWYRLERLTKNGSLSNV